MKQNKLIYLSSSFYEAYFSYTEEKINKIYLYNKVENSPQYLDIYLGQIVEKQDSLGYFFVKLDNKTKAILKYHNFNKHFKVGERILVQVVKEETFPDKLALVSDNISLYGVLVSYLPLKKNIIFAKKISKEERSYIISQLQLEQGGIIVRSNYKATFFEEFNQELKRLVDLYQKLLVKKEIGLVHKYDFFEKIILSSSKNMVQEIVSTSQYDTNKIKSFIHKYKYLDINLNINFQNESLFEKYQVEDFLQNFLSEKIQVNDNVDLLFYMNDAFNYIDVDFKGLKGINISKENIRYQVNISILQNIIDEIIARNLSGQILIDLLKLNNKQYKQNIITQGQIIAKKQDKDISILGFSNLGLLEISRKKMQDNLVIITSNIYFQYFWIIVRILDRLKVDQDIQVEILGQQSHLKTFQDIASKDLQYINSILFNKIKFIVDNKLSFPIIKIL